MGKKIYIADQFYGSSSMGLTGSMTINGTASGQTLLDIQGTSGQLFSITDDLTGDVFAVSDISGIPVLKVNTDGTTTVEKAIIVDGICVSRGNNFGCANIAIGKNALSSNIQSFFNTAIGEYTLASSTYSFKNTAIGAYALKDNLYGSNNTAVGLGALCANQCNNNTAVGYYSLRLNTLGGANTAVGTKALYANTTGYFNTAVGHQSLRSNKSGSYNTAVGRNSLSYNTTGYSNTAVGDFALSANTTGYFNTAIGASVLESNTYGWNNTAVGNKALQKNTSGSNNIAIGICTLGNNTSGHSNTAVGRRALLCNTTGTQNTGLGFYALRNNTTGIRNTAVGISALQNNTTGSANIAIGSFAQCTISTGVNNTIAIGCLSATSATTGHTVWGNSGNNVCNCVYAAWSSVSDCRDKTNIKPLSEKYGLALISKLRPVAFNWDHRDTYVRECKYEYGQKDGNLAGTKEHYGLIAQELKSALEELEIKFDGLGHDNEKDAYRLTYEELIAPIIKAVQELNNRLEIVENKLAN